MSRFNTGNPIGSGSPLDLDDNAKNLDVLVNSTAETNPDRFGRSRLSYQGMENKYNRIIDGMGLYPAEGSFETGGAITERNQYLILVTAAGGNPAGGYSWAGSLPKSVPAGSNPSTTGGVNPGAWVYLGDATVRAALADGSADIFGTNADVVGSYTGGALPAALYLVGPATPSGAVAAAVATGAKSIYIGQQFEGLDVSGVFMQVGQSIFGHGVNLTNTSNTYSFAVVKDCSVTGINITGSGKNSGLTLQDAYLVPSGQFTPRSRTRISNTNIKNMGGSAYRGTYLVNSHEGNVFTNYNIESCNIGINADERHEYLNASIGNISLCNIGVRVQGGNTNLTGVVISDNDIGIDIIPGENDAHGQVIGALLNHNITRTIRVGSTTNGFLFSGCQIFNGGPIELNGCQDVWFRSCTKNAVSVIEDGATRCGFSQCLLRDDINNVPNANGNPSEVFYLDNRRQAGAPLLTANGVNGGYLRLQVDSTIATIPTGVNDFTWPVITSNSITGNLNYTVQYFYAASYIKGATASVVGGFDLKINTQMTFGKPAQTAWNASQLRVYLMNAAGDIVARLTPEVQASIGAQNTITYTLNGIVQRADMRFVIENNTGGLMSLYRQQAGTVIQTFCVVTGW